MNKNIQKNIKGFTDLSKQGELWHSPSLDKKSALPAPIAHAYHTLHELVENGEIYQAIAMLEAEEELSYSANDTLQRLYQVRNILTK